jgi:hypothetical protein
MTIHAVDKNMYLKNAVITYRDRPEGSESKLNTIPDGFKVLRTIFIMLGWIQLPQYKCHNCCET